MGILKNMTIMNKGLRYKLLLAFTLMSVIPLLACTYVISNYLFPRLKDISQVSIVVIASIFVAVIGLALARRLVNPVIEMAIEAKIIANGEYDRKIAVSSEDEIGNLATSINSMTSRIKSNMEELKSYGQRMREINVDIHKKVLALSSLLQIGDIISASSMQLDALLEIAVEKASTVFDAGFGVLYMAKEEGASFKAAVSCNLSEEKLNSLEIKDSASGFCERILTDRVLVVLDKAIKMPKEAEAFKTAYNLKNALLVPIYSGKRNFGMLIIGNRMDDFKYKNDDVELVKVFAKQITIAIESDMLSKKTKELAIKDDLTDLYNRNFIVLRLEEEIKRAIFYQRPCSFVIFNIDNFRKFGDTQGELACEEVLRRMAKLIKDNATPVGKVARISGDEFAMLLPEKNKRQAAGIAEEVRKKIESTNLLKEGKAMVTVSGGVSENPIDGTTGDELLRKAAEAVKQAKSLGKNRIVA